MESVQPWQTVVEGSNGAFYYSSPSAPFSKGDVEDYVESFADLLAEKKTLWMECEDGTFFLIPTSEVKSIAFLPYQPGEGGEHANNL